jgi:hypothetical protein
LTLALVGAGLGLVYRRGHEATSLSTTHEPPATLATLGDDTDDAIPDELVVDFRDDESHERIAELGRRLGVSFAPASSYVDVDEIYTVATGDPERLLAALRAEPDVEAADFEILYRLPEEALEADEGLPVDQKVDVSHKDFPNDPKYKYQWHLHQVHAKET